MAPLAPLTRLCAPLLLAGTMLLPALHAPALYGQTAPPAAASPDGQIVEGAPTPKSPAEIREAAWVLLTNAVNDPKQAEYRSQGLAAVGLLGNSPRGIELIDKAMVDHDIDIRTAAVLAAGETKAPAVTTPLRQTLDDKEPPVAFAAAVTLWKMHDYSGEDILIAVAKGDRTTAQGRVGAAEHDMSKSFHHPGGLARFAAMQGAGMLLGPFGYGITAYEYLKKNGGDVARVTAIELLSQNRTGPIREELLGATLDKDPGVRLASAKALARYQGADVATALSKMFTDEKAPVRVTAAAAYLISTGAAPGVPDPNLKPTATRKKR